jgi:hypothetical protein
VYCTDIVLIGGKDIPYCPIPKGSYAILGIDKGIWDAGILETIDASEDVVIGKTSGSEEEFGESVVWDNNIGIDE